MLLIQLPDRVRVIVENLDRGYRRLTVERTDGSPDQASTMDLNPGQAQEIALHLLPDLSNEDEAHLMPDWARTLIELPDWARTLIESRNDQRDGAW